MSVQVKIIQSSFGYTRITAEGHAEQSDVCAAVSAVMWGLAGSIINLKEKPNINAMVLNSGLFEIDVSPMGGISQSLVDTCFKYAHIALSQIARQYPEQITVE